MLQYSELRALVPLQLPLVLLLMLLLMLLLLLLVGTEWPLQGPWVLQ